MPTLQVSLTCLNTHGIISATTALTCCQSSLVSLFFTLHHEQYLVLSGHFTTHQLVSLKELKKNKRKKKVRDGETDKEEQIKKCRETESERQRNKTDSQKEKIMNHVHNNKSSTGKMQSGTDSIKKTHKLGNRLEQTH